MNYNIFSISTTILILLLMIYSLFNKKSYSYSVSNKQYYFIIAVIFILALFASLYEFGAIPYGYHVDEAGMAYDAYSLANYGVDRYLNPFPVYLTNYGGGQSSLYAYIAAIFIKIFGLSIYTARLPIIIFRITSFICLFSLTRNNKIKSIFLLLLYAICPYFVLASRFGLDCNLMLHTIMLAITFTIFALRTRKVHYYVLASLFFGVTLYSYAISYLVVPIMLVGLLFYAIINKKISLKEFTIVFSIILIMGIPLLLFQLVNSGYIDEINSFVSITKLPFYRSDELSIRNANENLFIFKVLFTTDDMIRHGDGLLYNSFAPYYTLYILSIPFFYIGIFKSIYTVIKNKLLNVDLDYLMLLWYGAVLLVTLMVIDPNINRANAIFIPMIYFTVIGIECIIKKIKYFGYIITCLYLINFASFFHYYLNDYSDLTKLNYLFSTSYDEALKFSLDLNTEIIYSQNLTAEAYIYPHLYYELSPYEFNKYEVEVDEINKTLIYYMPEEFDFDAAYITHVTFAENFELEIPSDKTMHYEVFLDKAVIWFE